MWTQCQWLWVEQLARKGWVVSETRNGVVRMFIWRRPDRKASRIVEISVDGILYLA